MKPVPSQGFEDSFNSLFRLTTEEKNQSSVYWRLVRGIHRSPVDSPHEEPVMRKEFMCHDVIIEGLCEPVVFMGFRQPSLIEYEQECVL